MGTTAALPRRIASYGWGSMLVASLCCHLVLALWLIGLPPVAELLPLALRAPQSGAAEQAEVDAAGQVRRDEVRARPGGQVSAQNVDAPSRGERGDETGAVEFVLLVAGAHATTLQDSPMNAPHVSQIQRIRTSDDRLSWENRRATPNPDDDPFLASGDGTHRERRPVAREDANDGARTSPSASRRGTAEDSPSLGVGGALLYRQPSVAGSHVDSPGRGILGGRGARTSERARVAHGRPPVDEGPAATLAQYQGRPGDDVDADLLAGRLMQSVVDASDRRGPLAGPGRGGVGGGGAPGSGGSVAEGGRAAPYGPGGGDFALDTSDRRYRRWYLEQRRRVEDALHFPRERALAMDQGTAVYRLTIRRDGTLERPPAPVRSSGFADLDTSALLAIRTAAPFAPLPADLVPDRDTIRINLTVEFSNPLVR